MNIAGMAYGDVLTFDTTQKTPLVVTTLTAAVIDNETATLHGQVIGGGTATENATG